MLMLGQKPKPSDTDTLQIMLSRAPLSSSTNKWASVTISRNTPPKELKRDLMVMCQEFVNFHKITSQVCIFNVTNGPKNSPLLGVYFVQEQKLVLY